MAVEVNNLQKKYVLRIRKRNLQEWMVLAIALWPFLMHILLSVPGMPGIIRYAADGMLLVFALLTFTGRQLRIRKSIYPLVLTVLLFAVYTMLVYLVQFQSPFYYLWGVRNNFRGYIAFFIFMELTSEREAKNWFQLLDILFWINFVLSVIQFFALGVRQDYLGGIFGTSGGTNGYTQIFMCIVLAKSLLSYQTKQENIKLCMLKCVAALLIAAMAELKAFFVFFAVLLIMVSFMTRFTWRKLVIYVVTGVALIVSVKLLEKWFGFEGFYSLEYLWRLATKENYATAQDLNRLSAICTLSKTIVTHPLERLFGLGLGNCDTSSFSIFNTPFYSKYSYLHYIWFSAPMMFLETGFLGLIIYLVFFVMCYLLARKQKNERTGNRLFCQMSMIMSVLCVMFAFYNSTLRIEAAYMIYFVLALPFIKRESVSG